MIPPRQDDPEDVLRSMTVIGSLNAMHMEVYEEEPDGEVLMLSESHVCNDNDNFVNHGKEERKLLFPLMLSHGLNS